MKEQTYRIAGEESSLKKGERDYLIYESEFLAPAEMIEDEDSFMLVLPENDLLPAEGLIGKDAISCYTFLVACYKLKKVAESYSFRMSPENIAYDITFAPKILLRLEPNESYANFKDNYAALACAMLYPDMKYEDYLAKAGSFSGKKGMIDDIIGAKSAEEIRDILKDRLTKEKSDAGKPIVKVNRKKYRALRVALIVAIAFFVLSSGFALKFVLSDIPALKEETSMSNAFIRAEYPGVIKEAKAIGGSKLTTEERYMAAYAAVKTAALSSQQKDEVLSTLKPTSDKMLLDYWIYMGLLDYDKSLDLAKRIGKSDLEIYALLIMKEDLTNDRALSGADKEAKLKSIDEQLTELDENIG